MKNNLVIGIIIGVILSFSLNVVAENIITANQVTYNDSTVQTELDSLFDAVDINERLGNTDISSVGDGTVSSAISTLNSNITNLSNQHSNDISSINTSLSGKQATITGGASTIASSNLGKNKALISNGSGKVAVSGVTSTELGYLSGVTSSVQTQLNAKAASSHNHDGRYYTETEVNNLLTNINNTITTTNSNINKKGTATLLYDGGFGTVTLNSSLANFNQIEIVAHGYENVVTFSVNMAAFRGLPTSYTWYEDDIRSEATYSLIIKRNSDTSLNIGHTGTLSHVMVYGIN